MRPATYDEVVELLKSRDGVPRYWAGVFVKAKLSLRAIEVYLETSELDVGSPLRLGKSEFLGKELEDLQGAYGLAQDGGGVRYDETIRYLASSTEQDAVIREVAHYATVRFRPAKTASYCAHVVARAIRTINGRYLYKLVPSGARVLEAGADLRSLPYRPVDFDNYRAAVPVLGPRDVVRHSYQSVCRRILSSGKHDARVVERARRLLYEPDSVFEKITVQESRYRAEVIVTNDASHDIPFSDMPKIMQSTGASMWYGAMMRVKGLSRHSRLTTGEVPVLGAKYSIDYGRDRIYFHFKNDASFDYNHCLSEHRKYEEHTDHVFRGGQCDYIYTKLPATTDTTLFFCVYRVPAAPFSVSEPSFAPTGSAGKVLVKSIRAIGDDASGLPRAYEPYQFEMDEEIYEKVAERRHSQGVSGNLAMTISYMRSVRVRFYINGEPVGAENRMGQELLESAAVAIEVVVSENRRKIDMSLGLVNTAHADALAKVVTQAWNLRRLAGKVKEIFDSAWLDVRAPLVRAALEPCHKLVVEVLRQPAYVRVDDVPGVAPAKVIRDATAACLCGEKAEVKAALQFGDVSSLQKRNLLRYLDHLNTKECTGCLTTDEVLESAGDSVEEDQEFFDAESTVDSSITQATSCEDSNYTCSSVTTCDAEEFEYVDAAIDEYVSLQRFVSRAVKSKVKRDAAILFSDAIPTDVELTRFSTGRVKHYAVQVRNNEIIKVVGGAKATDLSACFSLSDSQLKWVQRKSGKLYVCGVGDGWIYSCSSLEVFNNDSLASSVECIKSEPRGVFDPTKCVFVQGVPGAGKTYEIVQEMRKRKDNCLILYLSATVASASEVRRRVYGDDSEGLKRVRTLDSFILNSPVKADFVWVDEAPMAHAGQLFAALHKCMPLDVRFYGDFEQIPFCSFASELEFRVSFASLRGLMPLEHRSVTHRCPADVCRMWASSYTHGFVPCECHSAGKPERSLSVVRISAASQIVYSSDVRYMVFTQQEKRDLHQALGFDASVEVLRARVSSGLATVHEDQGSTHSKVALVRLIARYDMKESPLAPSIYNRLEYALTATTRHTEQFVYYTTSVERDIVVRKIDSVV